MEIRTDVSLRNLNTFGIDARASFYVDIKNVSQLEELLTTSEFIENNRLVLGGGSNILFRGDFDGLVININIGGVRISESDDEHVVLDCGAGYNWHSFVESCMKSKFYGLENLALIPGKVGAAPVQNIGAYGVEQKDFFLSLEGIKLDTGETVELGPDECCFSYRDSIFKKGLKDNFIVTSVKYKLHREAKVNLSYKELKNEIEKFVVVEPGPEYVFDTVCRLRRRKLADTDTLGNAGSFFKNPVVDKDKFSNLMAEYSDLPGFEIGKKEIKIPAAWLIEKAGWKGFRKGDAGVYEGHALVLVNYGNASGSEIYSLSEEIRESVFKKFGIELQREIIVV